MKFNLNTGLTMVGRALLGVLAAMLFYLCIAEFTEDKSKVALVNVNGIIHRYIQASAKSNVDEKTLQENTARFMRKLEDVLISLAREKRIGLLMSEAMVAGGVDYTPEIEQRVYKEYQKEGSQK